MTDVVTELPAIRRYTELVRQGPGSERERLALMREHHQRVTDQLAQLGKSLDLISHKVGVYEDIVAQGGTCGGQ